MQAGFDRSIDVMEGDDDGDSGYNTNRKNYSAPKEFFDEASEGSGYDVRHTSVRLLHLLLFSTALLYITHTSTSTGF